MTHCPLKGAAIRTLPARNAQEHGRRPVLYDEGPQETDLAKKTAFFPHGLFHVEEDRGSAPRNYIYS